MLVRFHVRGFHPGSNVNIVLSPADRPSCCAITIPSVFLVSAAGSATLVFKMPGYYLDCPGGKTCHRVDWASGEKVVVTVVGYLEQATTTTSVRL